MSASDNLGQPNANEPDVDQTNTVQEIAGGIKNALEKGSTMEKATQSFLNGGYNPQDVQQAVNFLTSSGVQAPVQPQGQPQTQPPVQAQQPPQQQVPPQAAQPQVQGQPAIPPVQNPQVPSQQPATQPPQQVNYSSQVQSPGLNPLQQPPQTQPPVQAQQPPQQQVPPQAAQLQGQPQLNQVQQPPMKKEKKSLFGKKKSAVVNPGSAKARKSLMKKQKDLPLAGAKPKSVPKWLIILLIVLGLILILVAGFLGVFWDQLTGPF